MIIFVDINRLQETTTAIKADLDEVIPKNIRGTFLFLFGRNYVFYKRDNLYHLKAYNNWEIFIIV